MSSDKSSFVKLCKRIEKQMHEQMHEFCSTVELQRYLADGLYSEEKKRRAERGMHICEEALCREQGGCDA